MGGIQRELDNSFSYHDYNNCQTCSIRYKTTNTTRFVETSDLLIITINRDGEDTENRVNFNLDGQFNIPLITGGNVHYEICSAIEHHGSIASGIK